MYLKSEKTMLIDIKMMKGEIPRLKSHLLSDEASTKAIDVEFENGVIQPVREDTLVETLSSAPSTLYLFNDFILNWDVDVDVVKNPMAQDDWDRIYWTGQGSPKVSSNDIISDGTGDYPAAWYDLGIPAPTSAPIITDIDDSTGSNPEEGELASYDDEDRVYVQTFVSRFGEEGPASDASEVILVEKPGSTITITLAGITNNIYNIDRIRLYRSVTTDSVSEYMLVAELPLATTEYIDSAATIDSAVLETLEYTPPDSNMVGLTNMANGICAGFAGNELMFSESYLPYAWPEEYRLTTEHDIVAIQALETSLVVGTKGYPYLVSGVTPSAMTSGKIPIRQACVSKASMVNLSGMAVYASPDGLVGISSDGTPALLTIQYISQDQWQAYNPDTIRASVKEGKYIAQYEGGAFIFDPDNQSFTQFSDSWDCACSDIETDTLYVAKGAEIYSYKTAETYREATWRSKTFLLPKSTMLSCARVQAAAPELLTVNFYVDGALAYTVAKGELSDAGFRLPAVRGMKWEVEVIGKSEVERIVMATSMKELA